MGIRRALCGHVARGLVASARRTLHAILDAVRVRSDTSEVRRGSKEGQKRVKRDSNETQKRVKRDSKETQKSGATKKSAPGRRSPSDLIQEVLDALRGAVKICRRARRTGSLSPALRLVLTEGAFWASCVPLSTIMAMPAHERKAGECANQESSLRRRVWDVQACLRAHPSARRARGTTA